MDKTIVRQQDTITFLVQLARAGFRKEVWEDIVDNYTIFKDRYFFETLLQIQIAVIKA